jgi:hypothetical protein
MIGCAVSIWIAAHLGNPGSVLHDDRPLSRLLRGMALIKGVVTLAAIAAVAWRFGWPVSKSAAAAYLLGSWSMVLASMLIWRLSYIAAAAILFHAAVLCMLFVSWRGDGIRIR